jgi:hypothetical protein
MEIILRRIKQTSVPNNGGGGTGSPTSSVSNPLTTTTTNTGVSGHRENFNIEDIKQELFVNDRGIVFHLFIQC